MIVDRRLEAADRQEQARQDLCAGKPTKAALTYARYLLRCEGAASINSLGQGIAPLDADVFRRWPFLSEVEQ